MKKIRLPRELYEIKHQPCAITICSNKKRTIFNDIQFIEGALKILEMESNSHNIAVYGFCFMPDHLHLVIATRLDYNLIDWIGGLKGKLTKLSWDFGYTGAIFQKRFYDHIIRDEANLLHHVKYVLDNPVRKNLENHRRIFPFVGSFIYDIEELTGAGG